MEDLTEMINFNSSNERKIFLVNGKWVKAQWNKSLKLFGITDKKKKSSTVWATQKAEES